MSEHLLTGVVASIASLAQQAAGAGLVESPDGRRFLVHAKDTQATEITDPHGLMPARPRYIKQAVTLQTRDSLADYVNRFKVPASLLFADIEKSTIVAVLDYHERSSQLLDDDKDAPGVADHTAHRAQLVLPFSEEWKLWSGISGKMMGQLEFARFVEENAPDIVAPSAADLLEAARDLQAHRKVNFVKAVRTESNNENFEFTVDNEARTKGGLELPTQFVLNLPVYFGEPQTELRAFLRWEISEEGGLKLGVQLSRAEHVRQAQFRLIATELFERTHAPVVYGRIA